MTEIRKTTRRGSSETLGIRNYRETETWDAEAIHESYDDVWVQEGSMPYVEPREGFEQRWIRSTIGGQPDPQRLAQAANQGWRRRDPSTVPTKLASLRNYVEGVGGVVGVSGMILMERPKKLGDVHRAKRDERTDAQKRSVEESLFKVHSAGSGFGLPGTVEERTKVSRGKRPVEIADD